MAYEAKVQKCEVARIEPEVKMLVTVLLSRVRFGTDVSTDRQAIPFRKRTPYLKEQSNKRGTTVFSVNKTYEATVKKV